MIKGIDDRKRTPKQMAAHVLDLDLENLTGYWEERWASEVGAMTPRELEAVTAQVNKYEERIRALLNSALLGD